MFADNSVPTPTLPRHKITAGALPHAAGTVDLKSILAAIVAVEALHEPSSLPVGIGRKMDVD